MPPGLINILLNVYCGKIIALKDVPSYSYSLDLLKLSVCPNLCKPIIIPFPKSDFFYKRDIEWQKKILLLLVLLLIGITSVRAEEELSSNEYTGIVFDRVTIHIAYVFDFSLLKIPIGIDNPSVDLRDISIEEEYFQKQVDREKLKSLYKKIEKEISTNNHYSFVHLQEFDENEIILMERDEIREINYKDELLVFVNSIRFFSIH